jgi:hypothetical protein
MIGTLILSWLNYKVRVIGGFAFVIVIGTPGIGRA